MIRGLIIGKFMPIHLGHIALIRFAAAQCNEVIVSMSYTDKDSINAELRFSWIKEIFKNDINIKPVLIEDNFDDESLPLEERTKKWASVIGSRYPKIHKIFSSESYGESFARNLGATHVAFDYDRKQIAVSATLVRDHPFQYWNYIPDVVRPYFVKNICFYGPESTGKSTMSVRMAQLYNTEFVPEVARELITSNDFTVDDIIRIGYAQTERVKEKRKVANKMLFCDTDVITTEIYSYHYLRIIPPVLFDLEKEVAYDYYFLFNTDTPWVADHMRDLGEKRVEMYNVFKAELDKRRIPYPLVTGNYEEREQFLQHAINKILSA
ncbi:AAA family ATPase [Chryseosolibacter indicus]|uniref:AAA family ATPase n=1 Tax=Chryseosolibacter indicus TaxID=2782351 RepID=A0ABS5VQ62_9BACT|nr:AAA family ATPase [Chryseosolibacter indicus]MBT1702989.1 AAA family ATPase [Chryseosolibacter indicus]